MKLLPVRILAFALALFGGAALSAQITPPYAVDFETADGYVVGDLAAQDGWTVPQGTASVTNAAAYAGSLSIGLLTSSGRTEIHQAFSSYTGGNITYLDFWARPVVAAAQPDSTTITVEGALFSLVRLDDSGSLIAFDGDGSGGGRWVATGHAVALDSNGRASGWVRFTVRQNYIAKKWDLYLDGQMALHDLGFKDNTQTHLAQFSYLSSSLTTGYLDTFYVGSANPLFVDSDNDGMEDSWESSHGLNTALDDRASDLDGDSLTNIEEYNLGTDPNATDTDGDGLPDAWEVQYGTNPLANDAATDPGDVGRTLLQSYTNTLSPWPTPVVSSGLSAWYRADKGILKDGSNKVSQWTDVSGNIRHAGQANASYEPTWSGSAINGLPAVTFASSSVLATGMIDLQSASTDLSIILVFKPGASQTANATVLDLNQGNASGFALYQRTGAPNAYALEWSPTAGQFSGGSQSVATASGTAQILGFVKNGAAEAAYLNGNLAASGTVNAAMLTPLTALGIGGHRDTPGTDYFSGDLAEILIYDRALTTTERRQIEAALKSKYAIDLAGDPDGDGLTNGQEFTLGTNPYVADTDGDGLNDGQEYAVGSDPLVADLDTVPSHISGGILHLKADTGLTVDGSGNVSAWADQSGNSHDMQQASSGNRPSYQASGINSHPSVRFNGSSQFLTGTTTTALKPENITIIAVYKVSSNVTWGSILSQPYRSSGWGEPFFSWGLGATSASDWAPMLHTAVGGARISTPTAVPISTGTPVMVAATYDKNIGSRLYLNGDYQGGINVTGPISYDSGNLFYLGSNPVGEGLNGEVAEVLVYNRVLSGAELEDIGVYLQGKYAVAGIATPSAPAGVDATAISAAQIDVRWQPGTTTSSGTTYTVERKTGTGSYARIAEIKGLDYLDTGLAAGTTYTYRIAARSYGGSSGGTESSPVTTPASGQDLSFSGLVLWLKAGVGVTQDGSGKVDIWTDQSGHGHDLQQMSSGNRPTYEASGINSRPSVRFNGGSQFLTGNTTTALKPDNITILAVYKVAGNVTWGSILSQPYRSSGWGEPFFSWGLGATSVSDWAPMLHTAVGGTRTSTPSGTPISTGTTVMVAAIYDKNAGSRIYVNGDYQGGLSLTGPISYDSGNLFYLGSNPVGEGLNGEVAEVLVYDRVLSAAELEAAGKYLYARYPLPGIATPSAPTGVAAAAVSSTQIEVHWQPGTTTGPGIVYSVERKIGAGSYLPLTETTGLDYLDNGLAAGDTCTYRLKARSLSGTSSAAESSPVSTLPAGPDLPLTGLRLWLKADTGILVDGSGNVSSWQDQSGNGNHVSQFTTGSKPTHEASGINSRPTVKFTGGQFLSGAVNAGLKPQSITMLAVYKVASGSGYAMVLDLPYRNSGWGEPYVSWAVGSSYSSDGTPVMQYSVGGVRSIARVGEPTAMDTPVYVAAAYDKDAGGRIYLNGVYRAAINQSGPLSYDTGNTFYVGSNPVGEGIAGQVAELLVYDRVLSTAELQTVGGYLNQKYAFTSGATFDDFRDSNGDGVSDNMNRALGLDPYAMDTDGDGVSNALERARGTNPLVADTDGDGVNDEVDAFPLDPTRWDAPTGTSSDTTPPVITLTKPASAVLQP